MDEHTHTQWWWCVEGVWAVSQPVCVCVDGRSHTKHAMCVSEVRRGICESVAGVAWRVRGERGHMGRQRGWWVWWPRRSLTHAPPAWVAPQWAGVRGATTHSHTQPSHTTTPHTHAWWLVHFGAWCVCVCPRCWLWPRLARHSHVHPLLVPHTTPLLLLLLLVVVDVVVAAWVLWRVWPLGPLTGCAGAVHSRHTHRTWCMPQCHSNQTQNKKDKKCKKIRHLKDLNLRSQWETH